jgi:hypothetical protein
VVMRWDLSFSFLGRLLEHEIQEIRNQDIHLLTDAHAHGCVSTHAHVHVNGHTHDQIELSLNDSMVKRKVSEKVQSTRARRERERERERDGKEQRDFWSRKEREKERRESERERRESVREKGKDESSVLWSSDTNILLSSVERECTEMRREITMALG